MNSFEIKPFETEKKIKKLNSLFTLPMRGILLGQSGSGKTTFLYNIVINHWTAYENLYIFTKTKDQEIYERLENLGITEVECLITDGNIIPVDDCKPNSLVIFDDYILQDQTLIKQYFVTSRPKNISVLYLSQNYTSVDSKLIRKNLNILCAFKQSDDCIELIWKEKITSISLKDFKFLCYFCWKVDYGFITIDLKKEVFYNKLEKINVDNILKLSSSKIKK